jgi:integrase
MGKLVFAALERNDLAGRRVCISCSGIIELNHSAKRDGREIGRRSPVATRRRDEADHVRAHASPSHTAIATRPSSARQIKYAVKAAFGDLLRRIDAYQGDPSNMVRTALRLLCLTAVRTGAVNHARWKDFDLDAGRWVLPFKSLKMARKRAQIGDTGDFIVPLSTQAIALPRDLHKATGDGEYLFPGGKQASRPLSMNALNSALISILGARGIHCAHGFRSSFSSIMNGEEDENENRLFEPQLIELALDHRDSSVRAIYDRDPRIGPRRRLMQHWADLVDQLRTGAEIIPFRAAVSA